MYTHYLKSSVFSSPIRTESLGEVCDLLASRVISVPTVQKVTTVTIVITINNALFIWSTVNYSRTYIYILLKNISRTVIIYSTQNNYRTCYYYILLRTVQGALCKF